LGDVTAVSVVARRTTGLPSWQLPGPVLELGPTAGGTDTVALDRLYVRSDGDRAELRVPGRPGPLVWHNGELDSGPHTALALPRVRALALPDPPYLPRLRWANVVLCRRRWRVRPVELDACRRIGDDAQRLAAVHRLWAERGWPEQCFARASTERKPVFVDTRSPLLLDVLARLSANAAWVDLTEVLPEPEHLWLRDGELRFAAEMRCVYLRPGGEGL
jgi:hypothetical protein